MSAERELCRGSRAEKRAEDADYERQRRQTLKFVALDMVAEEYGQAEWQRFRRENPYAFYRAKVEVCAAPPAFRLDVREDYRSFGDLIFRFEWFAGELRRYVLTVSARELQRQELDDKRAADSFLGHAMRQAAWEIERDSGAAVSLRIRGNRAAHEEALKGLRDAR